MKQLGLLGICFDEKSSFLKGPAEGPPLIRQVLNDGSGNPYSELGVNPSESWSDLGDALIRNYQHITDVVLKHLDQHESLLIWGGDHSITYPVVEAFADKRAEFDILHIDAHGDLYDSFEGDPHSHACPFARIMESGLCGQLTQIGIRTLTPHQRSQIEKWNIRCIEMKDIHQLVDLQFNRPLYVSIDLDGIDPAYAPGVSHCEPGGLSPRQVISLIQNLKVPIIGGDIVEYNPTKDHGLITAYLAAKLTKELGAKIISSSPDY